MSSLLVIIIIIIIIINFLILTLNFLCTENYGMSTMSDQHAYCEHLVMLVASGMHIITYISTTKLILAH